ncbi:MAG: hypothetical protein MK033_12160 [Candidatus Caenarcaniphilales bacterium]|nr:hypothetical protein [Candidatus Caenarcaniphilales bacterium]
MQFMNMLVGTVATKLGKQVVKGLRNSINNSLDTKNLFNNLLNSNNNNSNKVETANLSELNLSPGELNRILKLREIAQQQGQEFVSFEINNQTFNMDVESFDMKAV